MLLVLQVYKCQPLTAAPFAMQCNVASSVLTPACPLGLVRARISPLLCLMFASTWLIAKHLGVYNVYIQAIHTHRFTKSSRKTEATLIHLILNGIKFCMNIRNDLVQYLTFIIQSGSPTMSSKTSWTSTGQDVRAVCFLRHLIHIGCDIIFWGAFKTSQQLPSDIIINTVMITTIITGQNMTSLAAFQASQ